MTRLPYKEPTNLNELIEQICLRPAMFAGSHNFKLAAAIIDGYHYAASKFQPEVYSSTELREFSIWLAEKFDYPDNFSWSYIQSVFPDDETTFANLPLLFKEFINIK